MTTFNGPTQRRGARRAMFRTRCRLLIALVPIVLLALWLAPWEKRESWLGAFSPDVTQLATVSWIRAWQRGIKPVAGRLKLSNSTTQQEVWATRQESLSFTYCVAFAPDGNTLATGHVDGTINLWDVTTGKLRATWPAHKSFVTSVVFSSRGDYLASSAQTAPLEPVKLWNVATGTPFATLDANISSVAFSHRESRLAISVWALNPAASRIKIYDVAQRRAVLKQSLNGTQGPLTFSADDKLLAVGGAAGTALWDVSTGRVVRTIATPAWPEIAFSPDNRLLATGDTVGNVKLWDITNGQGVFTRKWAEGPVPSVAFSPDGRTLAAACAEGVTRICNVATGEELTAPPGIPPQLIVFPLLILACAAWSIAWVRTGVMVRKPAPPWADVAFLIALLLGGLLLRLSNAGWPSDIHRPALLLVLALLANLVGLVVLWAVLGRRRWQRRLPGLVAALSLGWIVPLVLWRGSDDGQDWFIIVAVVVLLGCLVAILRLCHRLGVRLVSAEIERPVERPERIVERPEQIADARAGAQFMLKDLLLWTAAAAGLFAVARFAAPKPMSIAFMAFLSVTGICLALVVVSAIAASLGSSRAW